MTIAAVVFDVGETLIDETRTWTGWADWLGVPTLAFFGAMGSVIERGAHHHEVYSYFRSDFDLAAEKVKRRAAGHVDPFAVEDLYPDVPETFRALQAAGYRLGIAGNQPEGAEAVLHRLGLPVELVAASQRWGVHKPSPAFFARIVSELGLPPARIAYVGDRIDNDVLPAKAAGMLSIFLKRGPWGYIQARRPEAAQAQIAISSLDELPARLQEWNAAHPAPSEKGQTT